MSLLGSFFGSIKDGLLGGIDNGANNALGPQAGLLSSDPTQPGAPAPQPTPDQTRQRRAAFLGNIGAALQTGQPIMNGIQNYQQQQLAQMQAAHQLGMQNRAQQMMGQFSQEMAAAGADQAKQAQIVAKYAPYLPAADIRGIASLVRTETPKPVGIKQTIEGIDPKTGQPATFALMDDGTVKPLQGIAPEKHLAADGDGNIYNTKTGAIEIPGTQHQVMQALIAKNKGDIAAAYDEYKSAGKQVKDANPTQASLALQAAGGDPRKALELMKQKPAQVNVMASAPGGDQFKQGLAQKLASGEISLEQLGQIFPSRGQAGSQQRSEIVQAAMAMNPKLDLTGSSATYKNLTNHSTVSTVKYIDNLNTNLGMLDSAVDTLGNGDWNAFNKLKMRAGGEFGNTNVSNYNALHSVMVNEAARALSGNGTVSDAARREADSIIPKFGSPQQVHQAISTLRQELANRRGTLISPVQYGQQGQAQQQPQQQPQGLPAVGGMYNGEKVLRVTKIK